MMLVSRGEIGQELPLTACGNEKKSIFKTRRGVMCKPVILRGGDTGLEAQCTGNEHKAKPERGLH
jgi:hypothetical protein